MPTVLVTGPSVCYAELGRFLP